MNSSYRPKKHLGQNFLSDMRIQQRIIHVCDLKPEDIVLEIGPGQGALTRSIAPQVNKLICVETDADLIKSLRSTLPATVEIIHADILKWDMGHLPKGTKVIGNIPYYISTPIIEKMIANRERLTEVLLTVQLEFGERLTAKPGGKDYGALSCFVQYYADTKMMFKIKNNCFKPAPKVDSCFLRLTMRPHPEGTGDIEGFLFKLIQTAFQQRRKTIVNSLKGLVEKVKLEKSLEGLGIKLSARPENLSLSNYISLSKVLML